MLGFFDNLNKHLWHKLHTRDWETTIMSKLWISTMGVYILLTPRLVPKVASEM